MFLQSDFYRLLNNQLTSVSVQKDIISSGMCTNSKFYANFMKNIKDNTDYKQYAIIKDHSERNIGPGQYNTPSPSKGPSYQFSLTPRFPKETFIEKNLNKSTGKIPRLPKIENNYQSSENLQKKIKKKQILSILNKKTKIFLDQSKREKLLNIVKEKQQRAEYRKHKALKDSICKAYTSLLIIVVIPTTLKLRYQSLKLYKKKIFGFLNFFCLFSKSIGKLRILGKKRKIKKSLSVFLKILPRFVQN